MAIKSRFYFQILTVICLVLSSSVLATVNDSVKVDGRKIDLSSDFYGYQSLVNRDYTGGQHAYDYSVHLVRTGEDTGERHRAFIGGRWKSGYGDGDHVLQWTSEYGDPDTWGMWYGEPEFWQGQEEGYPGNWWSDNCMDPEVLGTDESGWIMYVQVQIEAGDPIDISGQTAAVKADRIMLLTTSGGPNRPWTKMTSRGVVTNIEYPTVTMLGHHEIMYVPWDRDENKFWLYFYLTINGSPIGHFRIRSDDYTTFDYNDREAVTGLAEIGNQMGYFEDAPGAPLFTRITFTNNGGRTVPSLQFSKSGLDWINGDGGPILMEGSSDNNKNKNCYFLGLATWLGQGEIESTGLNQWDAIYGATTSNSPGGSDIFYAEIGMGDVSIDMDAYREPDLYCVNRVGTDIHILDRDTNYGAPVQFEIPTALGQTDSSWVFEIGDYNNDFVTDLFAIQKNSLSEKTDVHIMSGATSYQTFLLQRDTILGNTDASWQFDVGDLDRDGYLDLYCIHQTGWTGTEVHVLSGATEYQSWIQQEDTLLGATDSNWEFDLADYNNDLVLDLYCIRKNASSGTEVSILNGADGYATWLLEDESTLYGQTDSNMDFDVGDYDYDGIPDLYAIQKNGGSGWTEVHVLYGADGFNSWLLHQPTPVPHTNSNWSFYVRK